MPTEKPSDTENWVSCDDGIHLIQINENYSHYGWVFRKIEGGWPYSVRKATEHEMAHAKARQHLRAGAAQVTAQYQPAEQHQGEPSKYPPCDYCGSVPDHHPWHGSGLLSGVENRHIHACDACRGRLPLHPGQHQREPVAVLYANGSVLTKADCGDAFEICCKVETPLYTHADPGEVERLKQELLVARAQGRAEVVEMIADLDAETGLDDFIGSHAIADTGDYGSHWNETELREHFGADEPAASELERCRYDAWQIIQLEEETVALRAKLAEQEHSARELLRIIGMSVQGSAAYNRAVIAFHDSLNADTKPN